MTDKTIGNPLTWLTARFGQASGHATAVAGHVGGADRSRARDVRTIGMADLRDALSAGWDDFLALRSDILFICILYPLIGVLLVWMTFRLELIPLLGPVVAGFALVGPVAGVGMYELSRRRERGEDAHWYHALAVLTSPGFGAMLVLSLLLLGIFIVWLGAALLIYTLTLGPEPPAGLGSFVTEMLTTGAGWTMMTVGIAVGFCFALAVLVGSIVTFPLLLDRDIGLVHAVETSINLTRKNPVTVLAWGFIVAALLVIGSLPALLGLIFVMPVLGHATWHLYRRAVK